MGDTRKGVEEREDGKNGERYVRAVEFEGAKLYNEREKEREREGGGKESNSRYNFGAPRKLKLLRAKHAELSAVFLPGTIRIALSTLPLPSFLPDLPQVHAPPSSSSFSRETAPFNIVGGNASGKSRSPVSPL